MKPTYNKGLLIFLGIVLFGLFVFLLFLVYIKREYNIGHDSNTTTTSTSTTKTTTTNESVTEISNNGTSLEELGLKLDTDFQKEFLLKIGEARKTLKVENKFTENPNIKTNELSFYLNNNLCVELTQTINKETNFQNMLVQNIYIYNNEYLVIDYLTNLENYNMKEENVYFCNDNKKLSLKSINSENIKVNFDNSKIYYYSDNTGSYESTKDFTKSIANNQLEVSEYYLEIENGNFTDYNKTNNTMTINP